MQLPGPSRAAAGPGSALLLGLLALGGCSATAADPASTAPRASISTSTSTSVSTSPSATRGGASPAPLPSSRAPATQPAPGSPTPAASSPQQAAAALIARRWRAAAASDLGGWLEGVRGERLRAEQRRIYGRLQAIGIGEPMLVSLMPRSGTPALVVPATWSARAVLHYRIRGFDQAPRTFTLDLTFSAAGSSGAVLVGSAPADRPEPWDLPDVMVRRSARGLVMGNVGPRRLDDVLHRADAAAVRVRAVLGEAPPAVWVAPASVADAARLLGTPAGSLAAVAAVTDGQIGAGGAAQADRIVIVPTALTTLTGPGRDVVLAHELTHVAARRSARRVVPLWLSEGLAEYVAYREVPLREAQVAAPLLSQVRRSGLPDHLPADGAFEPGGGDLPAAYGAAWLVVRTLVEQRGQGAVVRFYRAAAGGLEVAATAAGDSEAVVDAALRDVLGMSRKDLERAWRQRVAALSSG